MCSLKMDCDGELITEVKVTPKKKEVHTVTCNKCGSSRVTLTVDLGHKG